MINRLNLTLFLIIYCLPLTAQIKTDLETNEKRKNAEIGAKPCKYENIGHPSVLVTPNRLLFVRTEVLKKKNERSVIYKKYIKNNADRWLYRSITIPNTGGWPHDFFCVNGSILELPEEQKFNPHLPSICPVCGETYLNEKIRAARRSFDHYWLCQAVRDLSLVYAIEGKREYAEKAIQILTKYADAYPNQKIQDLTILEAVNLIPLAEGYDLLYDVMTPDQRLHITHDLLWPSAQALTTAGFRTNWGSWHLSAIGVIGYATNHQRFIDFATQQFKAQISNELGSDGLWPESVSTYHFYPLDAFLPFIEAASNHGENLWNWKAENKKSIKKMFLAPLGYAYPNMQLAAINDGWYEAYLPQDQYTMAYYHYKLPEMSWVIQQIYRHGKSGVPGDFFDQHYRNLLYGEKLPQNITNPIFTSVNFPVLGIAVLRQGSGLPPDKEMMMTFDYGPFLAHGQPDKMGVTLYAQGKVIVPDYGTTGYGSALNRFLKKTSSHNTIVVDGKDQPKTKDRNLFAFQNTGPLQLASARTNEIVPGSIWTRTIMLADSYAIVWDQVEGSEKHQYDWFFHAEGNSLSLEDNSGNLPGLMPPTGNEFPYEYITDVNRNARAGNLAMAQWKSDSDGLGLWFMNSNPNQIIYTSRMPTAEGKHAPLLVLRQESSHACFLAVIKPLKGKEKTKVNQVQFSNDPNGEVLITVKIGNREDQIHLKKTEVIYKKDQSKPISISLSP